MKISEFFGKAFGMYMWKHVAGIVILLVAIGLGVRYGLGEYTHHGEHVIVPNVVHRNYADANRILSGIGMDVVVVDTVYRKHYPPMCVLEQSVDPGTVVKSGRKIYLVINAAGVPTIKLPDLADNGSYRDVRQKLQALGFKIADPEYIPGEKEWVYGIKAGGHNLAAGQNISIEEILTLQVGNGKRDMQDSALYIDPIVEYEPLPQASSQGGGLRRTGGTAASAGAAESSQPQSIENVTEDHFVETVVE